MRSTVLKGWLPFVNPFHSVRELLEEEEEEEEEEEYSHHQCTYSQQTNFVVGFNVENEAALLGHQR